MKKLLLLLILALLAAAQKSPRDREWNQPVEPFRIIGNVYYVGANEVTSYLIATPKGLIVIDGGFEETAPIIEANIVKLGFKVEDVKILLEEHAHYDHVGGLAELQRASHAKLYASAGDAPILARGGKGDPQFGDENPFPAVRVDHILRDGEPVRLGATTLVAHLTPGHTQGATTWTTTVDGKHVVFATSLTSPPPFRVANNPKYPQIAADYRRTFAIMRSIPCDVFLSSHGSMFNLAEKMAKRGGKENPFIDPEGFRNYVHWTEESFEKHWKEQSATPPPTSRP